MERVKIEFETITPLWTGDAWGENSEIKASSIMGAFRSAFAFYCKENNIPLSKLDRNGVVKEKFN